MEKALIPTASQKAALEAQIYSNSRLKPEKGLEKIPED